MQALSEVLFHIWRKISSAQNILTAQENLRGDPKLPTYLKGVGNGGSRPGSVVRMIEAPHYSIGPQFELGCWSFFPVTLSSELWISQLSELHQPCDYVPLYMIQCHFSLLECCQFCTPLSNCADLPTALTSYWLAFTLFYVLTGTFMECKMHIGHTHLKVQGCGHIHTYDSFSSTTKVTARQSMLIKHSWHPMCQSEPSTLPD